MKIAQELRTGVIQDLRLSLRSLWRQPGFSLVAIFSLALAIGFNSAIFSFLDTLFLRPFPAVRQPDRLVSIFNRDEKQGLSLPVSFPDYQDLRRESRSFSGLLAFQILQAGFEVKNVSVPLYGQLVSGNFFDVLGVRTALGRTFLPAEDEVPDKDPVVVLSHSLWRDRFGGDSRALGQTVRINGHPFTVIGVAREGFTGTSAILPAAFWVPLMVHRQVFEFSNFFDLRGGRVLQLAGRLRPGVSRAQAAAELRSLAGGLAQTYPQDHEDLTLTLVPFNELAVPPDRRPVFLRAGTLLGGLVFLILLMACINVGNLLLIRTLNRHQELAVRLALGGGRLRLLRQLLFESLVLAALACGLGLVIGAWTRRLLWIYKPPYFAEDALTLQSSFRVLAFSALVSLFAMLLFGLAPALEVFKPELISRLRGRDAGSAPTELRSFLRNSALVLEVGLCLVCISCAGLFIRSLENARRIDPGFDAKRLLVASFDLRTAGYEGARVESFETRLLEGIRNLPGVESASLAEGRVLGGWSWWRQVAPAGTSTGTAQDTLTAGSTHVGDDYFRTTGIPLVSGRPFNEHDRDGGPPVTIVNETLAHQLWPTGGAAGKLLRMDQESRPVQVVGVARDAKYRTLGEAPQPFLYLPLARQGSQKAALHLRARHPESLIAQVRRELRRLDSALPEPEIRTGSEIVERSLWAPQAGAVLLGVFGVVGVVIAAVGVFGVAAYSVDRRRFEIGLRMALGARPAAVLRQVLGRGMKLIGIGVAVGLACSFAVSRLIGGLLQLDASEGFAPLLAAALLLTAIGLIANLLPALRAAHLDPARTLRVD